MVENPCVSHGSHGRWHPGLRAQPALVDHRGAAPGAHGDGALAAAAFCLPRHPFPPPLIPPPPPLENAPSSLPALQAGTVEHVQVMRYANGRSKVRFCFALRAFSRPSPRWRTPPIPFPAAQCPRSAVCEKLCNFRTRSTPHPLLSLTHTHTCTSLSRSSFRRAAPSSSSSRRTRPRTRLRS
jgi:hypothetical protein